MEAKSERIEALERALQASQGSCKEILDQLDEMKQALYTTSIRVAEMTDERDAARQLLREAMAANTCMAKQRDEARAWLQTAYNLIVGETSDQGEWIAIWDDIGALPWIRSEEK